MTEKCKGSSLHVEPKNFLDNDGLPNSLGDYAKCRYCKRILKMRTAYGGWRGEFPKYSYLPTHNDPT